MTQSRNAPARIAGFTLVELLVVIGIIALLISILLPSLNKARSAANTVACSANLRSILQGMQMYAARNRGAIPGNAFTTARFMFVDPSAAAPVYDPQYSNANCPEVTGLFDWQSPIADMMGLKYNHGPTLDDRQERYKQMASARVFQCKENDLFALAISIGGSPLYTNTTTSPDVLPMPSYATAMLFHETSNKGTANTAAAGVGLTHSRTDQNVSAGYAPNTAKVGSSAHKIFIADAARYSNPTQFPDVTFNYNNSSGGVAGDQGAPFCFSNAWNRTKGNFPANAGSDARQYWARHGRKTPGGSPDSYKFNAGFFDGHVETLGDLEGSNPNYWAPKGTSLLVTSGTSSSQIQPDVYARFLSNTTQGTYYTVPE